MEVIREITTEVEKSILRMRIYSDRLLTLTKMCPDDGSLMQATGEMYLDKFSPEWVVEYLCPKDGEIFRSWSPSIDALTKQIAQDVLGEENKDR